MISFVSRARYDELVQKFDELRAENRKLIDRILTSEGKRPIYSEPPAPPVSAPVEKTDGDLGELGTRPTLAKIKSIAEAAARSGKLGEVRKVAP